ncbi:hypothetical protein [Natrialba sp. INN-245]|uniref:DUF7344 domain-containing protein n=1 Tax=Natrialba sp. INN-245 TaxID=2690967 RepID=UPI001F474022|nr:hypothetical protein [Natrialba sp. INN-245]
MQDGWPLDETIVRIALARTLELFLGLEREGMRSTAEFAILAFVIYLPYNGGGRLSRMDDYFDIVAELESAAVDLSADQVFRLIADDDVRTTIRFLRGRSETTLPRLAAVLAAVSATETGTIATEADYENARISLYHATLPRLDHHGLLAFHPEDGTVDDVSIPPTIYSCIDVETE